MCGIFFFLGESENLTWIFDLRLLPQYHAPTLRKDLALRRASVEEMDLDHLLNHLEVSRGRG